MFAAPFPNSFVEIRVAGVYAAMLSFRLVLQVSVPGIYSGGTRDTGHDYSWGVVDVHAEEIDHRDTRR